MKAFSMQETLDTSFAPSTAKTVLEKNNKGICFFSNSVKRLALQ